MNATVINYKNQFISKLLLITLHVVATGIFIALPFMFFGPRFSERPPEPRSEAFGVESVVSQGFNEFDLHTMRTQSVLFNAVLIGFFYLNMYFLVPKILTNKGWVHYFGTILICFAVVFTLNELVNYSLTTGSFRPGRPVYFTIINFLLVFGLSTALRLTGDRVQFERERKESETENLKSELSLLRSQVSPHFMFNVLNNLAALARKKSDLIEPVIIQLSHLMRYMLYDSGEKRVSIEKETEYLTSYIDLQKLRFGNDVKIEFSVDTSKANMPIEPMLLIPFVENAFKHGIGMVSDPTIKIELSTTENELLFSVRNKFSPYAGTKDPGSGIGIQNVRRRLDLLYKDMYNLSIYDVDQWFVAELKLILK
ncbi:MAG: histidine kinase [Chryseolinea sp.]